MILVRIISIISILLFIGCSKPEIVHETIYKEVKVPIVIPIERPVRPSYTKEDNTITYLLKVLEYTEILENTIDTYNNSIKKE